MRKIISFAFLALFAAGCSSQSDGEDFASREELKPDQRAALEAEEAKYNIKVGP